MQHHSLYCACGYANMAGSAVSSVREKERHVYTQHAAGSIICVWHVRARDTATRDEEEPNGTYTYTYLYLYTYIKYEANSYKG
jgi:hypothetical protein